MSRLEDKGMTSLVADLQLQNTTASLELCSPDYNHTLYFEHMYTNLAELEIQQ